MKEKKSITFLLYSITRFVFVVIFIKSCDILKCYRNYYIHSDCMINLARVVHKNNLVFVVDYLHANMVVQQCSTITIIGDLFVWQFAARRTNNTNVWKKISYKEKHLSILLSLQM